MKSLLFPADIEETRNPTSTHQTGLLQKISVSDIPQKNDDYALPLNMDGLGHDPELLSEEETAQYANFSNHTYNSVTIKMFDNPVYGDVSQFT